MVVKATERMWANLNPRLPQPLPSAGWWERDLMSSSLSSNYALPPLSLALISFKLASKNRQKQTEILQG